MRTSLGDASGVVQLVRPGLSVAGGSGPLVLADALAYSSQAPWPTSAAGTGHSLTRTQPTAYAPLPGSWVGRTPSPGAVDFVTSLPGDANADGLFNQLDIVQVLQAGKYLTGQPAAWSEGDWNGDGRFDTLDLVAALQSGGYGQGRLAAHREPDVASHIDAVLEQLSQE